MSGSETERSGEKLPDQLVMVALLVIGVLVFGYIGPAFAPKGASGAFDIGYLYVGVTLGLALALVWSFVARAHGRPRPIDGLTEVAAVVYVVTTGVAYVAASYFYSLHQAQQAGTVSGSEFVGSVLAGVVSGPIVGLVVGLLERARHRMGIWQILMGLPLGLFGVVAGYIVYQSFYRASLE